MPGYIGPRWAIKPNDPVINDSSAGLSRYLWLEGSNLVQEPHLFPLNPATLTVNLGEQSADRVHLHFNLSGLVNLDKHGADAFRLSLQTRVRVKYKILPEDKPCTNQTISISVQSDKVGQDISALEIRWVAYRTLLKTTAKRICTLHPDITPINIQAWMSDLAEKMFSNELVSDLARDYIEKARLWSELSGV